MNLYHGSRVRGLTVLLPVNETGVCGPTDGDRENFRDVVFLTPSEEIARSYAGAGGAVYRVKAEATLYVDAYAQRMASVLSRSRLRQKLNKLQGKKTYVCSRADVLEEL